MGIRDEFIIKRYPPEDYGVISRSCICRHCHEELLVTVRNFSSRSDIDKQLREHRCPKAEDNMIKYTVKEYEAAERMLGQNDMDIDEARMILARWAYPVIIENATLSRTIPDSVERAFAHMAPKGDKPFDVFDPPYVNPQLCMQCGKYKPIRVDRSRCDKCHEKIYKVDKKE